MTIQLIDPSFLPFISTFLFVFALVFGLLSYSKIGEFNKKVNALLALAIAGFSVIYEPLVAGLTQYMPIAAGLLIIVFFVALVKKVLGGKEGGGKDTFPIVVSIAVLLLILMNFSSGIAAFLPQSLIDSSTIFWIIGIIFVLLFFWGIYKYQGGQGGGKVT